MRVNWTKTAEYTFNDELDYIFLKWGKNGVHDFVELVEGHVSILKSGILPGVKLESLDAFKWVLSKQTSLIYAVFEDYIILLLLIGHRIEGKRLLLVSREVGTSSFLIC